MLTLCDRVAVPVSDSIPLGAFSDSLTTWANLDPHMILYIFLPGLIFGSAFAFGTSQRGAAAVQSCAAQL